MPYPTDMTREYNSFNIVHSFIAICKTYAQFDFEKDKPSTCISWPTGIDIRNTLYILVNFSGPYGNMVYYWIFDPCNRHETRIGNC